MPVATFEPAEDQDTKYATFEPLAVPDLTKQQRAMEAGRNIGGDNAEGLRSMMKDPSQLPKLPMAIASMPFEALDSALPHLTPEERQALAKTSPKMEKVEAAAELAGKVAPLLLPIGAIGEGGQAAKIIGLPFGATAASQLPEVARQAGAVFGNPKSTGGQKLLAGGELGMTGAIAGLGLGGSAMPERPAPRPTFGEAMAKAADKLTIPPEIAQKVKEAAPIVPQSAKAVVEVAKEVAPPVATIEPAKEPPKGETPNASENKETTEIHGDVRPQPVEVVRQVPAQEGGQGVQPHGEASPASETQVPLKPEPGPGIVGMGGATPSEFERSAGNPTAMKYRQIDEERQRRGLTPLTKGESVSDQVTMDKAMAAIDQDPALPDKLIADILSGKKKTIEDWENHVLMIRKIDLRDMYEKSARSAIQAYEDSKEFPNRLDDMTEANLRTAELSDQLTQLEKASRLSGSARGRALRSLQVMANEDYSLASLEMQARAAKGGAPITAQERAELQRMADEHSKALSDLQGALDRSKASEAAATQALGDLKREVAAQPKVAPHIKVIADKIKATFEARAAEALKDLTSATWSVGPEMMLKLADLGASKILSGAAEFAGWSAEMVSDLGDRVRPYLAQIWEAAHKAIEKEISGTPMAAAQAVRKAFKTLPPDEQIGVVKQKIADKMKQGKKEDLTFLIRKLGRMIVSQDMGIERDALINQLHTMIADVVPGIDREEVRDMFSGYGEYRQLSKDDLSKRVRDLKGQLQQIGKLEDITTKKPPLKSGVERRTPSDEERKLIKQVEAAKRQFGVVTTDPATQLKSALDAIKTRLTNEIADLQKQIDTREQFVKNHKPVEYDSEANALKAERDKLKNQFESIFGEGGLSDEERVARAKSALEKNINDLQERLRTGDISAKKTPVNRPSIPELEPLKQQRDALVKKIQEARKKPEEQAAAEQMRRQVEKLEDQIEELTGRIMSGDLSRGPSTRQINRPAHPELEVAKQRRAAAAKQLAQMRRDAEALSPQEKALKSLKTRVANRIEELEQRLRDKDFSTHPKKLVQLDPAVEAAQARLNKIQQQFRSEKAKWTLANRPKVEKRFDLISNIRRFSVLTGTHVLAKLAAFSSTSVPTMGAADVVGGVISKLPKISKIAERAPTEGGMNLPILTRAIAKGLTKGFVDAYQTATKGTSQLKSAYSPRLDLGFHWYQVPQIVHEVIKSPLRRAAFENSLARRTLDAERKGADVSDPLTLLALSKDAYLDSDRALLLENNRFANGIRDLFRSQERPDKTTGRVPLSGKMIATVGRVEFPIMTVPFNYTKQTLTSAFGLVSGSVKARAAFQRGIENLKPEEADAIVRHLKYGTIGGAMLLYGFFDGYNNANDESKATFGGYWEPHEKRKSNQAGVGGIKVGDLRIPGLVLHNPVLAVGQLGHTIGAIAGSKLNRRSTKTRGIASGTVAGMMGLLNDSPLGRQVELVSTLSDPRSSDWALGEHVKGLLIPQLMQEEAAREDTTNGKTTRRDPHGVVQHLETGIPVLRQTVPKK